MSDILYGFRKSVDWKLILLCNFVVSGKNYYEPLIAQSQVATADGRFEETMQYLTDKYQLRPVSALIQAFVARCDTSKRGEQSEKNPLGFVTPLNVLVRPCTDISMHCLKLTPVFIKCSTIYPNSKTDNDHLHCI